MNRFRFIHAADLHLDTPFRGIGRVAPEIADTLRDASLEAWDALVRLAIEREAAFLLLAGDLYDGAERGIRAQLRLLRGLEQLSERHIQVFIVHGNHDPLDGWSAIRQWPPGVTLFGSTDVQRVNVVRDGRTLATVHGISYPQRDVTENLALRFSRSAGEHALQIGLLHCNAGGNPDHEACSPCTVDDLRRTGLDYWALGHVHRSQLLSNADPLIVYPGCLQGRSTHQSEQGAKGALVLEADDLGIQSIHFESLDRVRFLSVDVDITNLDDVPALQRVLLRQASELRRRNPGRGLVLGPTLTGHGEVHRDLLRPDALDGLLRDLRRESEGDHPFLWWDTIRDRSRLGRDLEAFRSRGDFAAELLRSNDALRRDGERRERWFFDQLEPLRRGDLQRWVGPLDAGDQLTLLDAAERLALDMLEEIQES